MSVTMVDISITKPAFIHQDMQLIDIIKQLITNFEESIVSEIDVSTEAEKLIIELINRHEENLALSREGLGFLLNLNILSIQEKVIGHLKPLLHLRYLPYDVTNNQPQELLTLENLVSDLINRTCRLGTVSDALLLSLLELYQDIIERLWLISYLVEDRSCYALIVETNGLTICARAEQWITVLSTNSIENKKLNTILTSIDNLLQRTMEPFPSDIEEVKALQPHLTSPYIPCLIADIYLNTENVYRAIQHYQDSLRWLNSPKFEKTQNNRKTIGAIHSQLADAYSLLEDHENAIENYNQYLTISQELKDHQGEAEAYMRLGLEHQSLMQVETSIEFFKTCLTIAKDSKNFEYEMHAYAKLGAIYYSQKKYCEALEALRESLRIAKTVNAQREEAVTHVAIGDAYMGLEEYDNAIDSYNFCLKVAPSENEKALAYEGLGSVHTILGETSKALLNYEDLLQIARDLEDPLEEARALNALGNTHVIHGLADEAIRYFTESLKITDELKEKLEKGKAFCGLGGVYSYLGKYRIALEYFKKYRQTAEDLDQPAEKLMAYINLGHIYDSLGEFSKATKYCQKAVNSAQGIGDTLAEAWAHLNLGIVYNSLENHDRAIACYTAALELSRMIPNHVLEGQALGCLGVAYHSKKEYDEAIRHLQLSLQVAEDKNDLLGQERAYANLGFVYISRKRYFEAVSFIDKQLKIAEDLGHHLGYAVALNNLGICHLALSTENFRQAEDCFRKSRDLFSNLQRELGNNNQWKITIFEQQANAYIGLEETLIKQNKIQEALEATDFRRSRALVTSISRKVSPSVFETVSNHCLEVSEMQRLSNNLDMTFLIYSLSALYDKESFGIWIIRPNKEIFWKHIPLGNVKQKMQNEIFKMFPYVTPPAPPRPGRPTFRGEEDLFLDLTPPSYLAFLEEAEELTRGSEEKTVDAKPDKVDLPVLMEKFKAQLSQWYKTFIVPIEDHLPSDPRQTVTIIPDGFLAQIPFAAFRDENGKYLIEKHPLLMAPSIQVLHLLDQLPKDFPSDAVVVGNPTSPYAGALGKSEIEAKQIVAPLLDLHSEKILTREAPTVSRVVKEMEHTRWIHLACHGEIGEKPEDKLDPFSVFEGFLKLAPDEKHEKGYLHAQEIASLSLDAELVFLSACFSGRGKIQREGSIGPTWSFLAAGALSTVATYWKLPDSQLTLDMVKTFYRHVLGKDVERLGKARALQEAMRQAIKTERENPHKWGAFFLSGLDFDRNVST